MVDLSVIILSYNTKDVTQKCIRALIKSMMPEGRLTFEIVVVDNASSDGSWDMICELAKTTLPKHISIVPVRNESNQGFPRGNNQAIAIARGTEVLFLNSDVIIRSVDWSDVLNIFRSKDTIGALTLRLRLENGTIDPASHRGFPTIWNSFCYYSRLEKMTRKIPYLNKMFGGYHLTHLDLERTHEVDAISGAYFLTSKKLLEQLHGFDEEYFMYGEDIDLALRIKKLGYVILYYPVGEVIHLKYQSGLKSDTEQVKKTKSHFYLAMKIFYRKHYSESHHPLINSLMYFFIDLKSRL